jgi:small conductance mechanosensitive channel
VTLPKFVQDHQDWVIEIPIRVAVIILAAIILRAVLHRAINKLVRPVHVGEVPRILRPFKERAENSAFLASTGLLSERRTQRAATIGSVLRSTVSFVILVIAVLLVLSEVRVNLAPFIAGTSIIGVALGFGAQNLVKDFLAGMFMMLEDQYGVGDVIDAGLATGTVEAVGLRTTRMRDDSGAVWYVRNGEVLRIGNKSQGTGVVVVDVPVASASNAGRARETLAHVAQEMHADDRWAPLFLGEPEVLGVEDFDLDKTVIRVTARVRPAERPIVARELRARIHDALR